MTESVIVLLEKAAIVRVIHQEPAFAELFIAHLLGRTIRVEADLVDQLFNSSEKRLARFLGNENLGASLREIDTWVERREQVLPHVEHRTDLLRWVAVANCLKLGEFTIVLR